MMVSDPPSSIFRAAPKNWRGIWSARLSMPPDIVRPREVSWLLYARVMRVSESNSTSTSRCCSTMRLARSSTCSVTSMWREYGLSLLDATTSALDFASIIRKSVTSSGRSSTRRTMTATSG